MRTDHLTILPPKTIHQQMPPLNMLLHVPAAQAVERKQLMELCSRLRDENAWLSSRVILWVGVAFIMGLVLGVLSVGAGR